MTFVIILWSCALHDPLCTHPDATWSGETYAEYSIGDAYLLERVRFERANPTREVVSFEIMSLARWEHLRGSYNCAQIGGAE